MFAALDFYRIFFFFFSLRSHSIYVPTLFTLFSFSFSFHFVYSLSPSIYIPLLFHKNFILCFCECELSVLQYKPIHSETDDKKREENLSSSIFIFFFFLLFFGVPNEFTKYHFTISQYSYTSYSV